MNLENKRIGFAMTGSFCTFRKVISELDGLSKECADITPIMSQTAYSTDTRFGTAEGFRTRISDICKKPIISTVTEVLSYGFIFVYFLSVFIANTA